MKYSKDFLAFVLEQEQEGMRADDISNELFIDMCWEVYSEMMEDISA